MTYYDGKNYGTLGWLPITPELSRPVIDLTGFEDQIWKFAKLRYSGSRRSRYRDQAKTHGWKSSADYVGLQGEIAFSHWAQSVGSEMSQFWVDEKGQPIDSFFGPKRIEIAVTTTTIAPVQLQVHPNNQGVGRIAVLCSAREDGKVHLMSWTDDMSLMYRAKHGDPVDYFEMNEDWDQLVQKYS